MATMHAFLNQHHGDMDPAETVIYGPSTANQVSRNCVSGNSKLKKTLIKKNNLEKKNQR